MAQSRVPVPSYGPMRERGDAQQTGLPPALVQVGIDQKLGAQLPLDATFRDEAGRTVQLREYFTGTRPVILALVFYECPMLCNQILNGLTSTMKSMALGVGKDYEVVTVSFDAREGPELARKKKETYLQRLNRAGAETGWHFLTGDEANIKLLTEAVGFRYTYDAQTNQFAHASGIMILTPGGTTSHYFYGVEYAPRDVRLGLVEASAGKIGSPVDQILLYCYHYDPVTGKFSWVINLYRWAGALTVAGMVALLLFLRRRGGQGSSAAAAVAGARMNQGGTA
ncbi:MAG: SCO family protein [Acidobacteria bacterium]|nr:SCO family protein [Acidobacteriota bacterium]